MDNYYTKCPKCKGVSRDFTCDICYGTGLTFSEEYEEIKPKEETMERKCVICGEPGNLIVQRRHASSLFYCDKHFEIGYAIAYEEHVHKEHLPIIPSNPSRELHKRVMDELQDEWCLSKEYHLDRHETRVGMRSSQISALVMYLIKTGVIKEEYDD